MERKGEEREEKRGRGRASDKERDEGGGERESVLGEEERLKLEKGKGREEGREAR